MIVWLEKALVLAIHDRQSARCRAARIGARAGAATARLRRSGAGSRRSCGSARVRAARNHPFLDGNKRTTHVAYRTFLALNGADLVATDDEKYVAMLALAEGKLAKRNFAGWLCERLRLAPRGEAYEPRKPYRAKPRRAGARARSAR